MGVRTFETDNAVPQTVTELEVETVVVSADAMGDVVVSADAMGDEALRRPGWSLRGMPMELRILPPLTDVGLSGSSVSMKRWEAGVGVCGLDASSFKVFGRTSSSGVVRRWTGWSA